MTSPEIARTIREVGEPQWKQYVNWVVNNSTVLVTISIDGTTDIDVAPAGSFWLYDEGKMGLSSQFPAVPAHTQIYVKGSAGAGSRKRGFGDA